ncbi:hypothetical protein CRI93_11740 [Longimonas halophila]|uniref:Outer membrane protein beta-barrel domain-containing protein n=1 Tax=Longimonas halophila TaxID=1469170 RepID=A0A2H3NYP7_9BACT|nr:hypothetical protein [Longimonas halophila]PEN05769.1 hypothetical protein CRI93_11740 [Longimonas halophila]
MGYTFSPTVEWFQGENESGLRSELLYGGEVGINLGQYLEIGAEAVYGPNFQTDFSQLDQLAPLDRDVELLRYGARLQANLRTEGLIPYLSMGTGVMQFDTDGVETYRTLYTSGGAGVTYVQNRYRLSVGGSLMGYRYNPAIAFLSSDSGVTTDEETVFTPSLRAGVTLFLGGRPLDQRTNIDASVREQFSGGLRGVRLSLDPFVGRVEWADELGMPKDQTLRGVNAGVRLGSVLSVHGFYARGASGTDLFEDVTGPFEGIQMYGGEARARLIPQPPNRDARISPYIILGGGYLDVLADYDDALPPNTALPEDRFFATSGVGLDVPIGDTFGITGTVRSVFASSQDPTRSDNTDIQANLMYTVGVSFGLGGGSDRRAPSAPVAEEQPVPQADARTESERLAARLDSLEQRVQERQLQDRIERLERLEQSMMAARDSVQRDTLQQMPNASAPARSNLSGESMTVPVPEVGSVYIRFGEGAPEVRRLEPGEQPATSDVSADTISEAIRDALREQTDANADVPLTDADVERTVQQALRELRDQEREADAREERERPVAQQPDTPQTDARVAELRAQLEEMRREMRRQREELERARERADAPATSTTSSDPVQTQAFYRSFVGRPLTSIMPITGFRAGNGPTQYQVGIRADYRTLPSSNFRLMPEIALASSPSTTSLSLTANAAYSFGSGFVQERTGQPLEPYGGLGLGLASARALRLSPVVNVFIGTEYPLGRGALFTEYSTFNLFGTNRLLFGYRIPL